MQWVLGLLAVNVLMGNDLGNDVKPKEYLTSPNGQYSLVVQPDCNLVVYNGSQPFLGTNISNPAPMHACSLWMQEDGNLVVYIYTDVDQTRYSPNARWSLLGETGSMTIRSFLLLADDGSSAFYNSSSSRIPNTNLFNAIQASNPNVSRLNYSDFHSNANYSAWKPNNSLADFPYMPSGYYLSAGSKLQTTNLIFTLELGMDCNLQSTRVTENNLIFYTLWESQSMRTDNSVCQLALQPNGSLQILDVNSRAIHWSSNASGVSGVNWILKGNSFTGAWSINDIMNTSNVLWETYPDDPLSIAPLSPSAKSSTTLILSVLAGGVGGVIVLALTVLGLYFYARERFLDPSEKAFQARLRAKGGTIYAFSQIELLSTVHHKYLVSLVGFSCTRTHQVLIYEFMGGGDLRYRLQGESSGENPLSWRQRTNIVLQVAEGLEYLHDKCSPPIIHRDVKSTNILLTDQLVAKVADFGLSKLTPENATHVTTLVKGTPGYLDPEYHETGMLTEKSDVYAFGVVLMEILTGWSHMCIAQKVGEAWREEQVDGLADPNLRDDFNRAELQSLVELALWCARRRSTERPVMHQVVRSLYDLGLGGRSETLRDGIDLGDEYDEYECDTSNVELVGMSSEDLSTETQRIFEQQCAR